MSAPRGSTVNNKKFKGHAPVPELFQQANSWPPHRRSRICAKKMEISFQRLHSKTKKIQRSQRFYHSKPLDLNYKGDSPRADTKIQSLLLPEGSNPDTFREEKACCKKIWMDPEHCKSSSCTCSSPWYVLQQKQCHLSRSHRGGDNHSSHPKKLLIRLPPALYQDN